ncbi:MAG: mandelate racemase/muconate lactonizing enzyme family protein [Thermoplasmata archaeon]
MIKNLIYKRLTIPMIKPFKIFLGSSDFYEGFIVKIETDDGFTGYGEAVPTSYITGDTMGSIEEELKGIATLIKSDEVSPEQINEKIKRNFKTARASRAAVDMAIWDIIGKMAGMGVNKMVGNYRKEIKTSYTVDLVDPKQAIDMAKEFMDEGVQVFKIKLGSGLNKDVERVKVVRETIGNDKMIYVDFNQAYDPKKALSVIDKIYKYDIEFVEQPVLAADIKSLKFVRDRSAVPVMADEAIFSIYDAEHILSNEAADAINIKIMKTGGITDALKLVDVAESFNVPAMTGCMVETKLAVSAGLNVALAKKAVKYADLDGFTSLKEDITVDGLEFKNGAFSFKDYPGLGIKMKDIF